MPHKKIYDGDLYTNIFNLNSQLYAVEFIYCLLEKVLSKISNIWAGGFAGLNNIALYVIHAIILAVNIKENLRYINI